MIMMKRLLQHLGRGARSLYVALGVVLIWRGAWILMDKFEYLFFGQETAAIAVLSIILGIVLLFKHDHKLDELGHL